MKNDYIDFNPIYFYAQSMDNIDEDDFFIFDNKSSLRKVEDRAIREEIFYEMDKAVEDSKFTSRLKTMINRMGRISLPVRIQEVKGLENIKIAKNGKKIFLGVASVNLDSSSRTSNIDILIDIEKVNKDNLGSYAKFLTEGLIHFSKETNRDAENIEVFKKKDFTKLIEEASSKNPFVFYGSDWDKFALPAISTVVLVAILAIVILFMNN